MLDVRVIVLTGAGRAFCAGLDLQAQMAGPKGSLGGLGPLDANPGEIDLRNAPPIVLHNLDTPTICSLNGGAAGYGLDLALGCDIRIAGESAKLNPGFAKRGSCPRAGAPGSCPNARLRRRPPRSRSPDGRSWPRRRELGLVNRVVPMPIYPRRRPNWRARSRPTPRWRSGPSSA